MDRRKIIGIALMISAICVIVVVVHDAVRTILAIKIDISDILVFACTVVAFVGAIKSNIPDVVYAVIMCFSVLSVTMIESGENGVYLLQLGVFIVTISWIMYRAISVLRSKEDEEVQLI